MTPLKNYGRVADKTYRLVWEISMSIQYFFPGYMRGGSCIYMIKICVPFDNWVCAGHGIACVPRFQLATPGVSSPPHPMKGEVRAIPGIHMLFGDVQNAVPTNLYANK